jgi:hypothetical protein
MYICTAKLFAHRTQSVNAKYQLYNVITNEWCDSVLDSADYGRTDESSSLDESTAGR